MEGFTSQIKNSVIATLGFFSLFGRGLTYTEIIQYFYTKDRELLDICEKSPTKVRQEIEALLEDRSIFAEEDGWYSLAGKMTTYRSEVQIQLLEKCKKYLPKLTKIPFIRMVAVGNTLAFGAADAESDIDLFIIAEEHHLWVTRFFVTTYFHLLGVRRHGKKIKGRFCLSFYADTSALNLESIKIDEDDIYLRFWVATLKPFFGKSTYYAFLQENEELLSRFPFWMPTPEMVYLHERKDGKKKMQFFLEGFWGSGPGKLLASWLKKIQKKKMDVLPIAQDEKSSVIVSDHMLKFHNNDRRREYQEAWKEITN